MKLARYSIGSTQSLALVDGDGVFDIPRHVKGAPATMLALMEKWADYKQAVAGLAKGKPDHRLADVKLLAPVERPGKIMAIGLNYADHAKETGLAIPTEQLYFSKATTSLNGPFDTIELPKVSEHLDYEVELVAVIGKRCRHVSRADAPSVIFGYCVGNDVSVRDWQVKTSQFTIGKSFDTHAPIGPWIVTGDSIDPHKLAIKCEVNGETRQSSNTNQLVFDCYAMVEFLSKAMTLEPGDLLFTGTPAGVGLAMKPPHWLKKGDVVRSTIEGIGVIENTVKPE